MVHNVLYVYRYQNKKITVQVNMNDTTSVFVVNFKRSPKFGIPFFPVVAIHQKRTDQKIPLL